MRVSEVCSLPIDCLEQGSGLLRLGPLKTGKERTIPLSPSTALVVQEQRHALTQEQHGAMDLLFCDSTGQAISPHTLLSSLNRLAIEKDIRDATGNVWRFYSLQFRATLAAQMIRQHFPISLIQRYFGSGFMEAPSSLALLLGHTTSSMNLRYLHLT